MGVLTEQFPFAVALGIASGAFLAVFLPRGRVAWHTFGIVLSTGIVLWTVLVPRAHQRVAILESAGDSAAPWQLVLRVLPLVVVAFFGLSLLARGLKQRLDPIGFPRRIALVAVTIVWSSVAATMVLGPSSIITIRSLQSFAFPAAVAALLLLPAPKLSAAMRTLRWPLGFVTYGSLLVALVQPDWAFFLNMGSSLSPFPHRLAGLTTHPNSLGFVSLVFLVLGLCHQAKAEQLHRVVAVTVLFLTASKTAWAAAALVLLIVLWGGPWSRGSTGARVAVVVLSLSLGFFMALVTWASLGEEALSTFGTFTGRTAVWVLAIDLWASRPLFGHGAEAWSAGSEARQTFTWAGHAHNQVLQSLSVYGLYGAGALLIYTSAIVSLAIRARSVIAYSLVGVHLLRYITESPVVSTVIDLGFLTHLTIIVALVLLAEHASASSRQTALGAAT